MKLTMSKYILSSLLAASSYLVIEASPLLPTPRIVGGDNAQPGDYPYFVDMGLCGGVLIAPDVVLTAAHCPVSAFDSFYNRQVSIGAYKKGSIAQGAQDRFCEETVIDPLYSESDIGVPDNDFALCKLNEPVEFGGNAIALELNEDYSVPVVDEKLRVMGFGFTDKERTQVPEYLQELEVPHISNDVCNEVYNPYNAQVTDHMLCAGYSQGFGKDSCKGDSGGPLVKRTEMNGTTVDVLVGITSWGSACGFPNFPGVYARTSERIDWIKNTACYELGSIAPFCDKATPRASPSIIECGDDEEEVLVQVTTDARGNETVCQIVDSDFNFLMTRIYYFDLYENKHTICLKSNAEYAILINDDDGMCANDECGSYSVSVNDEVLVSGDGRFEVLDFKIFTIGDAPQPSAFPSFKPSSQPSSRPSLEPSFKPSAQQSLEPSSQPSSGPSFKPSVQDSSGPSSQPSSEPSSKPSVQDSSGPSSQPSLRPSSKPSDQPSTEPSSEQSPQPSQSSVGFDPLPTCGPGNDHLRYQMTLMTDYFGDETTISTYSFNEDYTELDQIVFRKEGFASNTLHTIPSEDEYFCLEENRCYYFEINDANGDGMMVTESESKWFEKNGLGPSIGGYFEGRLGKKLPKAFSGDGNFGSVDNKIFCTGSACKDKKHFKMTKKKQSCDKYVKGGSKTKRCNKKWKGDFVYDWCPESCGRKAGIGSCGWLKGKEEDLKELAMENMDGAPISNNTIYE